MQFIGYNWELTTTHMIPDNEIDTNKLGWKPGDYWQVKEKDGKQFLVKVDPIVQFLFDGVKNG
jgi:hypothetical protein